MQNKQNLLLGITGTIASLNIFPYIYELKKHYDIKIILTKSATEFINPNGLKPLVKSVHTSLFDLKDYTVPHVQLLKDVDKFLILPATANFIAKLANGIADDLLSTTVLNYDKKIFLAPNMNPTMWYKSSVQRNISILEKDGFIFINTTSLGLEASSGNSIESPAALPSPSMLPYLLTSEDDTFSAINNEKTGSF
jgi:phosphopantothenoylcysteine decarboxylase